MDLKFGYFYKLEKSKMEFWIPVPLIIDFVRLHILESSKS